MWELDHNPVLPAGYRGLRGEILVALRKAQPLTATELATQFGVSATALRRHLKQMEESGVVAFRREVRGVGAPVFAYTLTHEGEELFPRAYAATLVDALETVRETSGREGVLAFFRRRWERITNDTSSLLGTLPLHERTQLLGELMTAHGYMSETNVNPPAVSGGVANERRLTLASHNCPLRAVAERFPEACEVEETYLAEVLDATVERTSRIVDGCNCCCYQIGDRAEGAKTVHAAVPAAAHLVENG